MARRELSVGRAGAPLGVGQRGAQPVEPAHGLFLEGAKPFRLAVRLQRDEGAPVGGGDPAHTQFARLERMGRRGEAATPSTRSATSRSALRRNGATSVAWKP